MFSQHEVTGCVARLEPQRRDGHLYPDEHGVPLPTALPIVVPGTENVGPLHDPGDRCPIYEMRSISFVAGGNDDRTIENVAHETLDRNEHWAVFKGTLNLEVDGCHVHLMEQDIALVRKGAERQIRLVGESARATVAREWSDDNGKFMSVGAMLRAERKLTQGEDK